jgi:hypothetical protein
MVFWGGRLGSELRYPKGGRCINPLYIFEPACQEPHLFYIFRAMLKGLLFVDIRTPSPPV